MSRPRATVVTRAVRGVTRRCKVLRNTLEWRAVHAQIRHRHRAAAGRVRALPDGRAAFESDEPLSAVTPGQAAVFYDGDLVVGGGWID